MSVSAIYVSWHDIDMLVESIASLARSVEPREASPSVSLIVVVNEADGSEASRIRDAWPSATVIVNDSNRGFGPAANQGAAVARADLLLFLNPDTRALGHPATEVVRAFLQCPHPAAVAPALVGTDGGRDQETFQLRRLPTLLGDARELLLIDRLLVGNPSWKRDRYLVRNRERPFAVEQAAAAALAVRRDTFMALRGFDERFVPAYWEDVDFCLRLQTQGDILFWPAARFEHVGGFAVGVLGERRFRQIYYRNALRYRRKHYSMLAVLAYRLLLLYGMALRALAVAVSPVSHGTRRGAASGFVSVARFALAFRSAGYEE